MKSREENFDHRKSTENRPKIDEKFYQVKIERRKDRQGKNFFDMTCFTTEKKETWYRKNEIIKDKIQSLG